MKPSLLANFACCCWLPNCSCR